MDTRILKLVPLGELTHEACSGKLQVTLQDQVALDAEGLEELSADFASFRIMDFSTGRQIVTIEAIGEDAGKNVLTIADLRANPIVKHRHMKFHSRI